MKNEKDTKYQAIARSLMHIMLYDNGAVNRNEPDNLDRYPKDLFDKITNASYEFFNKHPEFLTEEDFNNIAAGEQEENDKKYGIYEEYNLLNNLLNDYFDLM